jgi:predicted nucleic acid-binding protein
MLYSICSAIEESSSAQLRYPHTSPDPDDDKFIACALAGKADFLVTGNKRHFPQDGLSRARVVNAAELLEFITLDL